MVNIIQNGRNNGEAVKMIGITFQQMPSPQMYQILVSLFNDIGKGILKYPGGKTR